MLTLQELIEHGYVEKIETESTCVGSGHKVYVKLHSYSIGKVTIDVGIDEYLTNAITLINKMIEVDEEIRKIEASKPKDKLVCRDATKDDIKKLLDSFGPEEGDEE